MAGSQSRRSPSPKISALLFAILSLTPGCDLPTLALQDASPEAGASDSIEVTTKKDAAPRPRCGNGRLEAAEECDDGNREDLDGCSSQCELEEEEPGEEEPASAACGNGFVEPGEECDDGNHARGDGCDGHCRLDPECGNGLLEPGEQCDPPGTPECDDECSNIAPAACGNGVRETGEQCDDGNRINLDGCSSSCEPDAPPTPPASCGNGVVEFDDGEECEPPSSVSCDQACRFMGVPGCGNGEVERYWLQLLQEPIEIKEECDDGNSENGDGCSDECLRETDCGNGKVENTEACDDGNFRNGDGCTSRCALEECGNGVKDSGEACDDGNFRNGDGCTSACVLEACGDGVKNFDEACDDGNTVNGDGCAADCVKEPPTNHKCGNGTVDEGEECDDGNRLNGDGCSALCLSSYCGDGTLQAARGEECDDGQNITEYGFLGCAPFCLSAAKCGDGVRQYFHERCDDGNFTPGDGCDGQCQREATCGNSVVEFNERCDDGNLLAGDGCSPTCRLEIPVNCGDGVLDAVEGEDCDDGNFIPGDGCSVACGFEECGNGVLDPDEECELGVEPPTPGEGEPPAISNPCSQLCLFELVCGDGVTSPGEECDDEGAAGGCTDECTLPAACGDGFVDPEEECDDRNTQNGDGCSATCQDESACGNGTLETGEQCDDGNLSNLDSCSSKCRTIVGAPQGAALQNPNFDSGIAGWSPTDSNVVLSHNTQSASGGSGSLAVTFSLVTTSTGLVTAGAVQCKRVTAGQELSLSLAALIGSGQPSTTRASGQLRFFPSTDCTGTTSFSSVALPSTTTQGQWTSLSSDFTVPTGALSLQVWLKVSKRGTDPATAVLFDNAVLEGESGGTGTLGCGDGLVNVLGETCDDGNTANGDGCDSACHNEPVCGDGVKNGAEQCDDGNLNNGDKCSSRCYTTAFCGNRQVEAGETCDDGDQASGDGCSRFCLVEKACGDGIKQEGEGCDDGNALSGDGCSSLCRIEPVCGNGTVEAPEHCDDGNLTSDDGCSQLCKLESALSSCGDGIIQASFGEECEYAPPKGNEPRGNRRCRPDCKFSCYSCQTAGAEASCVDAYEACGEALGAAEAGPGEGRPRAELCLDLFNCVHETTPAMGDNTACSTSAPVYCATPTATNKCFEQFLAAAETSDPDLAIDRLYDPDFIVGAAFELAICTEDECGANDVEGAACFVACGNGAREGSEECDDGNTNFDDECAGCFLRVCGNGRRDPGEPCDPSVEADADKCEPDCTLSRGCGDGVLNAPLIEDGGVQDSGLPLEECDHPRPGCSSECKWEYCGDGIVQPDLEVRSWDGTSILPRPGQGPKEECDGAPVDGVSCVDCRLVYTCEQCQDARCGHHLIPLNANDPSECTSSCRGGKDACGCAEIQQAALDCLYESQCMTGNGVSPTPGHATWTQPCYCGDIESGLECAGYTGEAPPGSECWEELTAAAGTQSTLQMTVNLDDPAFAINRVYRHLLCSYNECEMCSWPGTPPPRPISFSGL